MDFVLGKIQPQAIESEEAILSEIISHVSRENIDKIMTTLKATMFYKQKNKEIFEVVEELYSKSKAWDVLIISQELAKAGKLEEVGGISYLTDELRVFSTAIAQHIDSILYCYYNRELIKISSEVINSSYNNADPFEIINKNESGLKILMSGVSSGRSLKEITISTLTQIHSNTQNKGKALLPLTGVSDLDNMMFGGEPGDLIIFAGRPGMGKSIAVTNVIYNLGVRLDVPVLGLSLEMSEEAYVRRMIGLVSKVDTKLMKEGDLTKYELDAINVAGDLIASNKNIHISDQTGLNVFDVKRIIYGYVSQYSVRVVLIDTGNLIEFMNQRGNAVQEIGTISRTLKQVAKALKITIIMVWQLNRSVESENDKMPRLKHLRDSGNVEQDADKVILYMRPTYYNMETYQHRGKEYNASNLLVQILAKHRDGPVGITLANINVRTSLIENYNYWE